MNLFKIPCQAETAEDARKATFEQHGRERVSWVRDDLDAVRRAIEDKQARAEENPTLYADKIGEYEETLRKLYALYGNDQPVELNLIEALALNEDARLVDRARVCAVWVGGNNWIVFGAV